MSLSLGTLETSLSHVFSSLLASHETRDVRQAAGMWARAYHLYASKGQASGGGIPKSSEALISSAIVGNDFFFELAQGVNTYWMSTVWLPSPGFVFVTLSSTGLFPLLKKVSSQNVSPETSAEIAVQRIARSLHTYTTEMVKVTSTNTSSGATAVVNVR